MNLRKRIILYFYITYAFQHIKRYHFIYIKEDLQKTLKKIAKKNYLTHFWKVDTTMQFDLLAHFFFKIKHVGNKSFVMMQ